MECVGGADLVEWLEASGRLVSRVCAMIVLVMCLVLLSLNMTCAGIGPLSYLEAQCFPGVYVQ